MVYLTRLCGAPERLSQGTSGVSRVPGVYWREQWSTLLQLDEVTSHVRMGNRSTIEWVLRIAVACEFLGHGVFALQGKEGWFKYFESFGIVNPDTIVPMLLIVGIMDVALALLVLVKPIRLFILWMALWGFWTALIRWPLGPDPVWDFFERWANWGAPLALLLLLGLPQSWREWWR